LGRKKKKLGLGAISKKTTGGGRKGGAKCALDNAPSQAIRGGKKGWLYMEGEKKNRNDPRPEGGTFSGRVWGN